MQLLAIIFYLDFYWRSEFIVKKLYQIGFIEATIVKL